MIRPEFVSVDRGDETASRYVKNTFDDEYMVFLEEMECRRAQPQYSTKYVKVSHLSWLISCMITTSLSFMLNISVTYRKHIFVVKKKVTVLYWFGC